MVEETTAQQEVEKVDVDHRNSILVLSSSAITILSCTFLVLTQLWYNYAPFGVINPLRRLLPLAMLIIVSAAVFYLLLVDHYEQEGANLSNFLVVMPFLGWYLFELSLGLLLQSYYFLFSFLLALGLSTGLTVVLTLSLGVLVRELHSMSTEDRGLILKSWLILLVTIVLFSILP